MKKNLLAIQMLRIIVSFFILSYFTIDLKAQATWTTTGTCTGNEPEILKVVIDACYQPEGFNEMVILKTGNSVWDYSTLSITGSGINFGGTSPNSGLPFCSPVANVFQSNIPIVSQLNAGVGACSNNVFYPAPNPIPPNSKVLVTISNIGLSIPSNALSYLCGSGPVYVISGNFTSNGGSFGFFKNASSGVCPSSGISACGGPSASFPNCVATATFNLGNCSKSVSYDILSFLNVDGASILPNGTYSSADCFDLLLCSTPPNPTFSNSTITACENSTLPASTYFNCTNCTGSYSVFTSASGGSSIYTGTAFPNTNFTLPNTTTTYYIEQPGTCPSGRTPVSLQINPAPIAAPTLSSTSISCSNPTVAVSAGTTSQGSNFTYTWSGPNGFSSTILTPTLAAAGTYNLTVTNTTNGCSKVAQFTITGNNTLPVADAGIDKSINCTTSAPTIGTAAIAGNTYLWSNGISTATQNVNTTGTYTLTVTNTSSGCTNTDNVVVTLNNTVPTLNPIASVTINCLTPAPILSAVASGGTGLTYYWSNASAQQNITVTNAGVYSVTVTNPSNGCTASQSVNVLQDQTLPNAIIANPNPITCSNTSVILNTNGTSTGSNFTYTWSGPNAFSSTALTPPSISTAGTYTLIVTNSINGCSKTASVNVVGGSTPATFTSTPVGSLINCINQSATLNAAGNGTLLWSTGQTSTSIVVSPNATNNYSVTLTASSGCTAVSTATVTVDKTLPSVNISNNGPLCTGTNLILNVSGGQSYQWTGPNGFISASTNPIVNGVTAANAGIYYVTVTAANGCTATAQTLVGINSTSSTAISASSNSPICQGNTLNLQSSSGGIAYSWSGPNNFSSNLQNPILANANLASIGVYTVTITAVNGCIATAQTTVAINNLNNTNAFSNTPCMGGSLNLSASGGTLYSWAGPNNFTSNSQNPSITNVNNANAGIYSVTISANGCNAIKQVSVNINTLPSNIVVSNNSPLCESSLLNFSSPAGYSYAWSGPNGFTSNLQNPYISNVTLLNSGIYAVTISDNNGCTTTKQSSVVVNGAPNVQVNVNTPCIGSSLNLTATGGTQYIWSGPNNFTSNLQNPIIPNVNNNNAGLYSVTVIDANTCSKIAQINASVNSANAGVINIANNSPLCEGNVLMLSASGGQSYSWSGPNGFISNSQNPSINNSNSSDNGIYQVTVTSANGCSAILQTTATVNTMPIATVTSNSPLCEGNNLLLNASGGTSYKWSGPNGFTSNLQNPILNNVSIKDAGKYTVSIVDKNNCTNSAVVDVEVKECTATQNVLSNQGISVFPNPVVNTLEISAFENIKSIKLDNSIGQNVLQKDINNLATSINMGEFSSGLYVLTVTTNHHTLITKIIKL